MAEPINFADPRYFAGPSEEEKRAREKAAADIAQSGASAASSAAGAERTRGLTPAEIRKAEADAELAELQIAEAKEKEAERQKKAADAAAAESSVVGGLARTIAAAAAARKASREGLFATGFGASTAKGIAGTPAADVAGLIATIGNKTAIDQLQELKAAGTALTPVSNTDIELLKNSIASLDQAQSDAEFQRSMDVIIDAFTPIYKRMGGTPDLLQSSYQMRTGEKLPEDAIPGLMAKPQKAEGPRPSTEMKFGGGDEGFVAEETKRVAAALQAAFDAGASRDDIVRMAQEMGAGALDPAQLDAAIQYRDAGGKGAQIVPGASERPLADRALGAVAESPVGAYAISAGSALTGDLMDEATGLIKGQEAAERMRFARDYSEAQNPGSSLLGSVVGGTLASVPAIRGARALMPGVSATRAALAGEAALGGVTGFGAAEEGEGLQGAVLGATLGLAGGAVPGAAARVMKPRTPEAVRTLRKAGVKDMSIGQVMGMPEAEAAIAGVMPGGGDVALRAQRQAFEQFQEAYLDDALKNLGMTVPKGLKPTKRMELAQKAFNDAYEAARSQMQIVPDAGLRNDLMSFAQRLDSDEFSEDAARRLRKLLQDTVQRKIDVPPGKGVDGDKYKSLSSLLGKRRAAFAKQQNAEMADGVGELQRILDDNARRHSAPEAVDLMDRADRGYAILTRAEEAAKGLGNAPGEFTPQQALGAARKGDISARNRAYARGEARGQQLAEAGVEALGKAPPAEVSRIERGIGFTGNLLGSPVAIPANIGMGIANAPGVRQMLNTAIAGQRPQAVQNVAEMIRAKPEYLGAISGAASLQGLQDRPEDMEELRRRYGINAPAELYWSPNGGY